MAQSSCFSSSASTSDLRFKSPVFSHKSQHHHHNHVCLPFHPLTRSKNLTSCASTHPHPHPGVVAKAKAFFGDDSDDEFSSRPPTTRQGLWSIRDDLQIRSESGAGQERFQSVIGQLFQHRIIRCGGSVDDDMANLIVAQLLYLDAVDPTKDIVMYVNSPGGSVTAGMAIFDTMKHIRPDVSTVCVGLAASMGAFLLSAGTKGKRFSLPNSRIMIHQPLGQAQGSQTDIEIQTNEMLFHKANLGAYLAYHTGQSYERINQDTDRDYFMSAKEAKEYGIIDEVIVNPLKALQPLTPTAGQ